MPVDLRARHSLSLRGTGVGLRREYFEELLATERPLDFIEIISENFMGYGGRSRRTLDACAERWPIVLHGVCLNIGGPDPIDREYLARLGALAARLDAPWLSDHLCFTAVGHAHMHDLFPLPFTAETIRHVVPRVREVQARLERPFLLENPSYYVRMPHDGGGELEEIDFLLAVVEEADCGLLLDINNIYVNAMNHGYDPHAFLERVPPGRVVEMHLAGHEKQGNLIIDTHGAPVIAPVWELYRHAVRRFGDVATLCEWDNDIPSLAAVIDEAERARAIQAPIASREGQGS